MNETVRERRAKVFAKYGGRCAYCGRVLPAKGWHADHRVSLYSQSKFRWNDNSTVDDLEPSCSRCNIWKVTYSVEQFRAEIAHQVERVRKRSPGYRLAEDFGLVSPTGKPVRFYFERFIDGGKGEP